jgi:hypothetical protein
MKMNDDRDPEILARLRQLDDIQPRGVSAADTGRQAFLSEAQGYQKLITKNEQVRRNGWLDQTRNIVTGFRKEHKPMTTFLATLLVVASLVFGAGGVTVAAAQGSQPDDPLYGVKLWSETTRLDLTSDPDTDFALSLDFLNRRAEEIQSQIDTGAIPTPEELARYRQQVDLAIQYALSLKDDQNRQALELVKSRLMIQQQQMTEKQKFATAPGLKISEQIRQMLVERIGQLETGITDPTQLSEQLRQLHQEITPTKISTDQPIPTSRPTHPVTGNGNPWATGTPTPGSGYGPGKGTGDCTTCTPAATGQGANPWTTGTPTPGSGYGSSQKTPGPEMQENGNGPQSGTGGPLTTPVPGKKGGNH